MTTRRAANIARIGLTVLAIAVVTPTTPTARADDPVPLAVLDHTFAIATGSPLVITVELPADLDADASFEVTSHARVDSPDDIARVVGGELPRIVDAAIIPSESVQIAGDARSATVSVLVDALNTSDDTLQFSRPGVFPISVDVTIGEQRGRAVTFVYRADTQPDRAINVTMVAELDTAVTIDAAGTTQPDPDAAAQLARLGDVLVASAVPIGVSVDPSLVAVESATDGTLAGRLAEAGADDQFLSAPAPPLDPSAAAAADASDTYTEWLRAGEDVLAASLGVNARRTVGLITEPLSAAAVTMQRDLGTRLIVVTPAIYDDSDGGIGVFTDTSQLIGVDLADDGRLPAAVIDRVAANLFVDDDLTTDERAAALAAVVLAHRQGVLDRDGDPTRHTVVLGTPDASLPDVDTTRRVTELLASAPGVVPIAPDEIVDRTEALLFDGRPLTITMPDPDEVVDITPRLATRSDLDDEAIATASMLVDDPETLDGWTQQSSLLPSTALADTDAITLAEGLRAEFALLRDKVELPTPFSVTITGGENTIPLRFTNLSDQPLRIRVRLIAPRLIVPGGDQLVELAPNGVTTLDVEVRTRSNGKSPVSLDVFTPEGELPIGERVPLEARVTILAGVGNLVTGVAALMLFTWWFRHWRRNRQTIDDDPDDAASDDQPADNETTTLPSS